jgi:transposase-like protein
MKPKIGRPSKYTNALADEICRCIAGGTSVRSICAREGMPSQDAVYRWLRQQPEFHEKYARAREQRTDRWGEEILEIADAPAADSTEVQRARLRVDARKWLMARMAPRKYGEGSRPVRLDLPAVEKPADVVKATKVVLKAMATGEITVAEAREISTVLEGQRKAIESEVLERRIDEIEKRTGK